MKSAIGSPGLWTRGGGGAAESVEYPAGMQELYLNLPRFAGGPTAPKAQ